MLKRHRAANAFLRLLHKSIFTRDEAHTAQKTTSNNLSLRRDGAAPLVEGAAREIEEARVKRPECFEDLLVTSRKKCSFATSAQIDFHT